MAERLSKYMDERRIAKMKAAYDALRALQAQVKSVRARIEGLQKSIATLEQNLAQQRQAVSEATVNRARGTGSDEAVQAAQQALSKATAALHAAHADIALLQAARSTQDRELTAAITAAAKARETLIIDITADIAVAIRSDPRLQERMELLYAAFMAMADPEVGLTGLRFSWELALTNIFPAPSEEQHLRIMKMHALDLPPTFASAA